MNFINTPIRGVIIIEPKVFSDERGKFLESYQKEKFAEAGIEDVFVQDNHSVSKKGVLRGMHYQCSPKEQSKLVRVVRGHIFDVVVDLRTDSNTYLQWFGIELSASNQKMLYVAKGLAHGFLALDSEVDVLYKASDYYAPELERGIRWDDPRVSIEWPKLDVEYSIADRDRNFPLIGEEVA